MGASRSDPAVVVGGAARPAGPNPLVIGCGALARELVELTRRSGLPAVDLTCLPASLHNRPERIPSAVRAAIRRARAQGYERIFVAYADCGTGGLLDPVLEEEGVPRLAGAHCYEVYAGSAAFAGLHDAEPGTFYLTDFLVRNFEGLVVRGLGLDRHPELLPIYFGNYRRLVYLAQAEDSELELAARAAAARLGGLAFERRFTGLGDLGRSIEMFAAAASGAFPHRNEIPGTPPDAGPRSGFGPDALPLRHERGDVTAQRADFPGHGPASIPVRQGSPSKEARPNRTPGVRTQIVPSRKSQTRRAGAAEVAA